MKTNLKQKFSDIVVAQVGHNIDSKYSSFRKGKTALRRCFPEIFFLQCRTTGKQSFVSAALICRVQ
jgi:hypothetical protein